MLEEMKDFKEYEIKQYHSVPPMPRLSVMKEANLDMMQEQSHKLLHQLSVLQERLSNAAPFHPLYTGNMCQWTGCETCCATFGAFLHHLQMDHQLNEKTAAQTHVQMQMVDQLEQQVIKEKARLAAMVDHLKQSEVEHKIYRERFSEENFEPSKNDVPKICYKDNLESENSQTSANIRKEDFAANLHTSYSKTWNTKLTDSEHTRPPHTYAALIRQAILESHTGRLTLNEIYNWFQTNFAYFKPASSTWKNAIRHNLSLHKCFRRLRNLKDSGWVVDEEEFQRRRFQPRHVSRRTSEESREYFLSEGSRSCSPDWKLLMSQRNVPIMKSSEVQCIPNHREEDSDNWQDVAPQDLSIKRNGQEIIT